MTLKQAILLKDENNRLKAEIDDLKRDTVPKLQYGLQRANEYGKELDKIVISQRAEIERLKHFVDANEMLKVEAVKEFAERLKKKETTAISCKRFEGVISTDDIDNLVKEFTEERGIKHEEASGTAASGDDAAKEGGGRGLLP